MLQQKLADIENARHTIYNNGVLVSSWKHEQELRHATEQVAVFKENLRAWAKEQAVEQRNKLAARLKTLRWAIDSGEARIELATRAHVEKVEDLEDQRSLSREKHEHAISTLEKKIQTLTQSMWRTFRIGGTKHANDLLHMTAGSLPSDSLPSGCELKNLSPSTGYELRLRARNAVQWGAWSETTETTIFTNPAPFAVVVGPDYTGPASDRVTLSWDPVMTVQVCPPLFSDLRLELQDHISFQARATEWTCAITKLNRLLARSAEEEEEDEDEDEDKDEEGSASQGGEESKEIEVNPNLLFISKASPFKKQMKIEDDWEESGETKTKKKKKKKKKMSKNSKSP